MKAIAFFAFLAVSVAQAGAALDVIDGAFGLTLGNVPDMTKLQKRPNSNDADDQYAFVPENPYGPLTEYTTFLVSDHGPVYQIQAVGGFDSGKSCRTELDTLVGILTEKYGQPNRDLGSKLAGISRVSFNKGSRIITVGCTGVFGNHKLKLIYVDDALAKDAGRKSKAAPDAVEKRDSTGL
ncbi:MAG: hypothetical protein FD165_305 [Gammaproteobacteria bacterium]|nr:MAG: hypothetical protein FD165_305 [Gammaproteobacteria bacterium]TND06884.1 MAG: hypothetical protein FD120_616 [Gammaproteobacteria bacterium]